MHIQVVLSKGVWKDMEKYGQYRRGSVECKEGVKVEVGWIAELQTARWENLRCAESVDSIISVSISYFILTLAYCT